MTWQAINDAFCVRAWGRINAKAGLNDRQHRLRPTITINGYRFKMREKAPRHDNGLCFALVLDLLGRATPAQCPSILFPDNLNAEDEEGPTSMHIDIPPQHGVHHAFSVSEDMVLYMLHLCPHAFYLALLHGGEAGPRSQCDAISQTKLPQLLALPFYNRMQLGDVTFRPKDTQETGGPVTRSVKSVQAACTHTPGSLHAHGWRPSRRPTCG